MSILTLSDLAQFQRQKQGNFFNPQTPSTAPTESQQRLQILIEQKRLGLPIEPMLQANPLFAYWLEKLEEEFPHLFNPKKKLYLNIPLTRQLNQHRIEVKVHIGIMRGKVHLFDFSIRPSNIYWHDHVKLWVATQYFDLPPRELKMTIFVLDPQKPITKLSLCESVPRQQQTQQQLEELLSNEPPEDTLSTKTSIQRLIEEIPEIPL